MSYQLKYKKLKYELKYLNLEKNETEELFKKCINNFERAFREKVGPDFEDPHKNKGGINTKVKREEIKNEKTKSEVKKVYRRIVTRTHPDKLEQLPNNTIKKKLIRQYKDAVNKYGKDSKGNYKDPTKLIQNLPRAKKVSPRDKKAPGPNIA